MKNYRINAADLFTNRIVYMTEPGERVIKMQVVGKVNLYEDDNEEWPGKKETYGWVTLRNLEDGTLHEFGLGWFRADRVLARFFAKHKQAVRYSQYSRTWNWHLPILIPNLGGK